MDLLLVGLSLLSGLLRSLQQLLQLILQNLVGLLLGLHIVLVGVTIQLLLLPIFQLNLVDLLLEVEHLSLQLRTFRLQSIDAIFHFLLLLLRLKSLSHSVGDGRLVEGLVGLNGLTLDK